MVTLAIIIWIAILLFCTYTLGPRFSAYIIAFIFFSLFQMAKSSNNKTFSSLKIVFFLLGTFTIPAALFLKAMNIF